MKRILIVGTLILATAIFLGGAGCDKERIVESTEIIHNTEYVELPPDTVMMIDTVFVNDSTTVHTVDTVLLIDTLVQINYVYDTVVNVVTDTVTLTQCGPSELLAVGALQYYTDPLVLELVNAEFGLTDGYIFYLSAFQIELTKRSSDVYDIYGLIDYWTTDWTGYYPLEYYWRLTYMGGDPADPRNWQMSDPPSKVSGHTSGVNLSEGSRPAQPAQR